LTEENEIVPQRRTGEIMKDTALSIVAGLTGLASSDKNDCVLSASRVFQGLIKGKGLQQLMDEWQALVEKGKIKEGYEKTSQHQDCFLELLRFLDNDCPDEIRFQTLKKIFLVAATETASDRESLLPYEYMKLCKSMSSGEIITMLTAYRILVDKKHVSFTDINFDHNWTARIVSNAQFEHLELVEIYKNKLFEKRILVQHSEYSGRMARGEIAKDNGLTSLGLALCKYIESYED
jgi:hypothetical protein